MQFTALPSWGQSYILFHFYFDLVIGLDSCFYRLEVQIFRMTCFWLRKINLTLNCRILFYLSLLNDERSLFAVHLNLHYNCNDSKTLLSDAISQKEICCVLCVGMCIHLAFLTSTNPWKCSLTAGKELLVVKNVHACKTFACPRIKKTTTK